jgi:hypothetical protein
MKRLTVLSLTTALTALAYDNKAGWKTDDSGNLVTDASGNPIMLDDSGKETAIAGGYIQRINSESAAHRRAAKEAQDKLAKFGDLDPDAARDAIEKTKDLDLSKMVEKGEIDKIKQSITSQYETQLKERDEKLTQIERDRDNLLRKNAFTSSKFLSERLAVPQDFVTAAYSDRFKIEDGQLVPVRPNGDVIYNSRGEIASVDEAFEMFISERQDKDQLLRAPTASGSGSGGAGGNRGGGNVMKRADYDKLGPMEKASIGQKVAKGELKVVD